MQKPGGTISGLNFVVHHFMHKRNCPVCWWKNGVAEVVSYIVTVNAGPHCSVILNAFL